MSHLFLLVGRVLLAFLFIIAGASKLIDPAAAAVTMTGNGIPASYAIPVGIFEVVAGLCLVFGFFTRLAALALAIFTILTIFVAHSQISEPMQAQIAMKNLAIAGGLLVLVGAANMAYGYDRMKLRRETQEAELRAARAEGRLEGVQSATPPAARRDHEHGRGHVENTHDGAVHTRKRRWWR